MTVRVIEAARAGWGLLLLAAPAAAVHGLDRTRPDRRARVVARILGARQLTQAALSGIGPSPEILALGVWVDLAHAATAAGFAAVDHSRARTAVTDAAIAAAWASLGHHDLRATGTAHTHNDPRHDRRRDRVARAVLHRLPAGTYLLNLADRADQARRRRA